MLESAHADPPQWALEAGLPAPTEGEGWIPYLKRLGYEDRQILDLFWELEERTVPLVRYRFSEVLRKELPQAWETYVRNTIQIDPRRRRELEEIRWRTFPSTATVR